MLKLLMDIAPHGNRLAITRIDTGNAYFRIKQASVATPNFLLKYNLEEMKNMLQAELNNYRLGSGLRMSGNIDRLEIGKLRLGPNGFNIGIGILGNLKVMVEEKKK